MCCVRAIWILQFCILAALLKNVIADRILSKEIDDNSYSTFINFITDTGIERTDEVQMKNLKEPVAVFRGRFKYITPTGEEVVVSYVADENGYVPSVAINKLTELPKEAVEYELVPIAGIDLIESLIHTG